MDSKRGRKSVKTNKLVILDYSTCLMHLYRVDANVFVNPKFIRNLGYNPDNVVYMFGDIETRNHKGILTLKVDDD